MQQVFRLLPWFKWIDLMTSPYRAVLFDLDGTLLRVEMRSFITRYLAGFYACCRDLVEFGPLQRAMRAGIHMLLETECGAYSNEERLFAFLAERLQLEEGLLRERFAYFLDTGLEPLAEGIQGIPESVMLLECCRQAQVPVVLATNPVFPQALIEARCRWAGLDINHFVLLTSFENSRYCKPQGGYFSEVAASLGVDPQYCLMVGNDTSHDLSASEIGMTTWLVDSYLLERDGPTWTPDYRGNHRQLLDFLQVNLAT
jgi:FMN phosphatase YigB (HAD superfamily)